MEIKTIVVGPLQTNCYLLIKDRDCLIVDPGAEGNKIKAAIGDKNLIGIIITHHHFDHLDALEAFSDIPVYDCHNLNEGDNQIGEFIFKVIHTFGHTDDSISIYFEENKLIFSGDFLFKGTVGRTDLETGCPEVMNDSITKIKAYDDNIVVYPGHGESSTIGEEKINNPFF